MCIKCIYLIQVLPPLNSNSSSATALMWNPLRGNDLNFKSIMCPIMIKIYKKSPPTSQITNNLGPFGYSWKLKTEKHYSKIIFKYVNSIVRPIFNEEVAEKWNLWVCKQCTVCTVHGKSQTFLQKKKIKKKIKKIKIWKHQKRNH